MLRNKKNSEDPSPLANRICKCGCGIDFPPKRSDQDYLNPKHANFGYNHGPRKEKYAEEREITKVIRKNDRILEKYFKKFDKQIVKLNFTLIKAEGFDEGIFTQIVGVIQAGFERKYNALYKFCFRQIKQGDIEYIEIREL